MAGTPPPSATQDHDHGHHHHGALSEPQIAGAWAHCVRTLPALADCGAAADGAAADGLADGLLQNACVLGRQPVSQAMWRRWIQDEQVLLKLCQGAVRVWQHSSSFHSLHAACAVLATFLNNAYAELDIGLHDSNALQASMCQQVQQSGVLSCLPILLLEPAISALASRAQPPPSAAAADAAPPSSTSTSSTTGSTSTSAYQGVGAADFDRHMQLVVFLANRLHQLWPLGMDTTRLLVAHCAEPMSRLALAVLKYVDHRLQQIQPQQEQPAACGARAAAEALLLQDLAIHASTCMVEVAKRVSSFPGLTSGAVPNSEQLLQSPAYSQSVAAFTAVTALAHTQQMRQQAAAIAPSGGDDGGDSSRSSGVADEPDACRDCGSNDCSGTTTSGDGSNSSNMPTSAQTPGRTAIRGCGMPHGCTVDHKQVWQLSGRMEAQLSASQHSLCRLLGVGSRALAWVAANQVSMVMRQEVTELLSGYTGLCYYWCHTASDAQQQQRSADQRAFDRQLHGRLMASVLLPWAASIPLGDDPLPFLRASMNTGLSACGAFEHWRRLSAELEAPDRLPAEVVQDLMPVLLELAARLQQRILSGETDPPAPAETTGPAADSDPTAPPHPSASQLQLHSHMWMTVLLALMVEHSVGSTPRAAAALPGAFPEAQQQPPLPILPQRLREVLSCMEFAVRTAAPAAALSAQRPALFVPGSTGWWALNEVGELFVPQRRADSLVSVVAASGPGSRELRQLHSLLFSMSKFVDCLLGGPQAGVPAQRQGTLYAMAVANACTALLAADGTALLAADGAAPGSSSSTQAATGRAHAAGSLQVRSVLPGLVLAGRCWLLWARELLAEVPVLATAPNFLARQLLGPYSISFNFLFPGQVNMFTSKLELMLEQYCEWLTDDASNAEQLAAWGHDKAAHLLRLAEEADAARFAAQQRMDVASLSELARKLQAVGAAFAALAVPTACNNPLGCSTFSEATELASVSGCVCGGCRITRYCGRACQAAHWQAHKPVCKALKAAAAAAAGAAPTAASTVAGTAAAPTAPTAPTATAGTASGGRRPAGMCRTQ